MSIDNLNYSTAIFLVNDEVRAVDVSYETLEQNPKRKLVTFKTFRRDIVVGDIVVVPSTTRYAMTCCLVEAVDVDVDFDTHVKMDWIVDKVQQGGYHAAVEQEQQGIETIKAKKQEQKRKAVRAAFLADNPDIRALPICTVADEQPDFSEVEDDLGDVI